MMNEDILDQEEQDIEAAIDYRKALPDADTLSAIADFRTAAKSGNTKVISLRIDAITLEKLKSQAEKDGLPYQTMIQSLISRYPPGQGSEAVARSRRFACGEPYCGEPGRLRRGPQESLHGV